MIKNMVHKWRADVYCFQESKLRGDIRETIKELWANRGVNHTQLESEVPKRGLSFYGTTTYGREKFVR